MEDKISYYWLPILWFIGFVFFLIVGAVTGWALSHNGFSRVMHDSYYVVAHYHYMFSVGGAFLFFVLWYVLFPKITGYNYNGFFGWLHFWVLLLGVTLSYIAQHFI